MILRIRDFAWLLLVPLSGMLVPGVPAVAHELGLGAPIVIDTDLGLDDAAALAIALQSPDLDITAVVATPGASGPDTIVANLERLLDRFNRGDIPLYAPPPGLMDQEPAFRAFAEGSVSHVLNDGAAEIHQEFRAGVYAGERDKAVILVLGPLSSLAAALRAEPAVAERIQRVVVAGRPDGWNIRFDPEAWDTVQAAGVRVEFVTAGAYGHKARHWREEPAQVGGRASLGAEFLHALWADAAVADHYFGQLERFHDELAVLYLLNSALFTRAHDTPTMLSPTDDLSVIHMFERSLAEGRQRKARVIFSDQALPDSALQPDVSARRAEILARNGSNEWFSQLLMNELHDHLGLYSVVGVKMGLRAAELLNAPPHGMRVVSHAPPAPPVSCINDGVIVSTGSTPGRGLFTHQPGEGEVAADFEYNGRRITLKVKPEYQRRIREHIQGLLARHSLEDEAYWKGVRRFGLEVWKEWHRCDLFDVEPFSPPETDSTAEHGGKVRREEVGSSRWGSRKRPAPHRRNE